MAIVFAGLVIAAVLGIVSFWGIARLWCTPRRKPLSKTPSDYGLSFEPINFFSRGVMINGWFVPGTSDTRPYPVIILVHGWSSNASAMLPPVRLLHEAGFSVLLLIFFPGG